MSSSPAIIVCRPQPGENIGASPSFSDPPRGGLRGAAEQIGWGDFVDDVSPPPDALRASTSPQGGGKFGILSA